MPQARADRYPSLAASAALHAAVIALALISWPWAKTVRMGDVVAVTLVTSAEAPAPAQAVQAPVPAPAQTEAPVPQAAPQPAAPVEAPPIPPPRPVQKTTPAPPTHPTPPQAKTEPQPLQPLAPSRQGKVAKQRPPPPAAPPKAQQQPQSDHWDALSQSLQRQAPGGARQSQAIRGPTRANQAIAASLSSGPANAAQGAALQALTGELAHMWNPNCGVRGADVVIKVTFKIAGSGRLDGSPHSSEDGASDPALLAASERAVRPVYQANPFDDPQFAALYGQTITVNFNQKNFCSNR